MAVPRGRALLIEDALDMALNRDIPIAEAARMAMHLEALMRFGPEEQVMRWVSNTQSYLSSLNTTVCVPVLAHFHELRDPGSIPHSGLSLRQCRAASADCYWLSLTQ
jgi:hypothetical protein